MKYFFIFLLNLFVFIQSYSQNNYEKQIYNLINSNRVELEKDEISWSNDMYNKLSEFIPTVEPPKTLETSDINRCLSDVYLHVNTGLISCYYLYFINYPGGEYNLQYIVDNLQSDDTKTIKTNDLSSIGIKTWKYKVDGKDLNFLFITTTREIE